MSLAIDVDTVTGVLLADGWHDVADASFNLDSYEFMWSGSHSKRVADLAPDRDPLVLHGGGQVGVCATGFEFRDPDGSLICGPLTAILAVRRKKLED
jgi:hypothetical protein